MFLGISIVGWALIALIYVPLSIVIVVLWRVRWRMRPRMLAVLALAAYMPLIAAVVEAVYVDRRFKALCAAAGLKIKRVVVVEGYYVTRNFGSEESLRAGHRGYRFVEWAQKPKGADWDDPRREIWRSELVAPGEVWRTKIEQPTAQFEYRHPEFPAAHGHLMKRLETSIVDRTSGEVIASHVIGYRYPGFIDRLWGQYLGGGPEMCGLSGTITDALRGIAVHR